jgi:hypothetical protein
MSETCIKIRANRNTGELEVEGPAELVDEWWTKIWPEMGSGGAASATTQITRPHHSRPSVAGNGPVPDVFGEFFHEFRSDVSDVDKMLIAGAFVQEKDPDHTFTTKAANQLLLDQNTKLTNASECVRRLIVTKRAFVVSGRRFRVSASGVEHLESLKVRADNQ